MRACPPLILRDLCYGILRDNEPTAAQAVAFPC